MSHKSGKIAALIAHCQGQDLSPYFLGYFECFNREMFYEAHDVLEELWLSVRKGPDDGFYKGLIQFAGAFVHLQKDRLRPAGKLFQLSRSYLSPYPSIHHRLDLTQVLGLITSWQGRLETSSFIVNPLEPGRAPRIALVPRLEGSNSATD